MASLRRVVSASRGGPPVITVSGLAGSGKSAAASAIARHFGLELVTVGDIFRRLAREDGLSLDKYLSKNPKNVHIKADRAAYLLAKRGGCVLVGRLTGLVAGPSAFKIFLVAPLQVRARRVALRDGISYREALLAVRRRDRIDLSTYRRIYGIDVNDFSAYNLVFDTQYFSREATARLLIKIVGEALRGSKNKALSGWRHFWRGTGHWFWSRQSLCPSCFGFGCSRLIRTSARSAGTFPTTWQRERPLQAST